METTTAFDLNQSIQQWRESLAQSPAFRGENLDELESHLRDSVAGLQTRGLSIEEAFLIATRRTGKGGLLEAEFHKVNGPSIWLDRILWMLIGVQVWAFVSAVIGRVARGAAMLAFTGYNFQTGGRALPFLSFLLLQSIVMAASLTLCWWLIVRKGQGLGAWFVRHLKQPAHLAGMCLMLWVFSTTSLVLTQLFQTLPVKFAAPQTSGELATAMGMASAWVYILLDAVLITLTLILARKRLRIQSA